MTTIKYWFNEFKRGRTWVFDEERPGRPIDDDHGRIWIREIADIVDISKNEKLGMRKLSARWVPYLLTV